MKGHPSNDPRTRSQISHLRKLNNYLHLSDVDYHGTGPKVVKRLNKEYNLYIPKNINDMIVNYEKTGSYSTKGKFKELMTDIEKELKKETAKFTKTKKSKNIGTHVKDMDTKRYFDEGMYINNANLRLQKMLTNFFSGKRKVLNMR